MPLVTNEAYRKSLENPHEKEDREALLTECILFVLGWIGGIAAAYNEKEGLMFLSVLGTSALAGIVALCHRKYIRENYPDEKKK